MGTLLVIDDSASVRADLVELLRREGIFSTFLEAEDGARGLKILAEEASGVDVVVCDLNMPKMDGYQFLRMARANPALAPIPVVMVTAESGVDDVVKAFELGANDFIVKPFNASILKVRLRNMLQIKKLQDQIMEQKEAMAAMAATDPLTGIPNVRTFRAKLEEELHRAARYNSALSLFMLDLDHFKRVNDTYGHPRGDSVLKESAGIIIRAVRKVDRVARVGGEEFAVILPHTGAEGAAIAAERLRADFAAHHFEGLEGPGAQTVSVGVAALPEGAVADGRSAPSVEEMIKAADEALYRAKKGGRDRVETAVVSPDAK